MNSHGLLQHIFPSFSIGFAVGSGPALVRMKNQERRLLNVHGRQLSVFNPLQSFSRDPDGLQLCQAGTGQGVFHVGSPLGFAGDVRDIAEVEAFVHSTPLLIAEVLETRELDSRRQSAVGTSEGFKAPSNFLNQHPARDPEINPRHIGPPREEAQVDLPLDLLASFGLACSRIASETRVLNDQRSVIVSSGPGERTELVRG
mmetsp:Transcript_115164/g.365947  ORF Transcript_115164/g.365947 Transcript_115164/m.365947 type:complete len:201 (+) Transcript_115164:102-704(+)